MYYHFKCSKFVVKLNYNYFEPPNTNHAQTTMASLLSFFLKQCLSVYLLELLY
jgi:hypothetical protein